jgi:bifunctional ADP-heptose synthase (sugar kinase/adenylyltransferase)
MQLTKAQQYSLMRLQQAIKAIEELVPKEQKRLSMQRKKQLEQAHETLRCHCPKLGFDIPHLGHLYNPDEYLAHARSVANQVMTVVSNNQSLTKRSKG